MRAIMQGRYILNPSTEIRIGKWVFTHSDIRRMFLDRRTTVEKLAAELGMNRNLLYRILQDVNATNGVKSLLNPPRMRILRFIARYTKRNGLPPMLVEIAKEFDMSPGNIHHHLTKLAAANVIEWIPRRRSIKIVKCG